jgi:lantibiotic modifying enzyme
LRDEVNEEYEPNHWCHGAPGSIPLLIEAYQTFKVQDYLDSALKAGKCVWKKGLLKKGFGLCHGTCGNAYSLMALYRATGDVLWQQRAQMFILWTGEDIVK